MKKLISLFRIDFDPEKRVYGLDVFRAISILVVLKVHGNIFLEAYFPGLHPSVGISGPELFFVLSGYLIGQIFMTRISRKENFTTADVWKFIRRRWFRTLPNYYLFLLFNLAVVFYYRRNLDWDHLSYFVFGQNLVTLIPRFFIESWSLTIEEWFYLSMPFWIFLFYKVWGQKNFLKPILTYLILIFMFRLISYYIFMDGSSIDEIRRTARQVAIIRLDSIMLGVLAAYFKMTFQKTWFKFRYPLLILGLGFIYGIYFMRHSLNGFSLFNFYFIIQSIGAAMLLSFFDSLRKTTRFWRYLFTHISLVSYSMYLSNIPMLKFIVMPLSENTSIPFWILFAFFIVGNILLSTLVYKLFEKPMMDLRDGKSINLRKLRVLNRHK